jgi:hypothetical protein
LTTQTTSHDKVRYYDLDWLRVLSTLAVFLFHSARAFDLGNWHIKNNVLSLNMEIWTQFLDLWIMPILFVISGASIYLALRSRTSGQFLGDRFKRIFIPLIFGILVIVPPQVYIERVTRSMFSGSFLEYYPHYFDGLYLGIGKPGNFAWMGLHLWYLLVLMLLSLLALPVFRYLGRDQNQESLTRMFAGRSWLLFTLALPIMFFGIILDPNTIGLRDFGGWNLIQYLFMLIFGFVLMASSQLSAGIRNSRWIALAGGILIFVVLLVMGLSDYGGDYGSIQYALIHGLRGLCGWCWVLALLGFANHYLGFSNNVLTYANEAVLPFYILHQTVIVIIDYFIVGWIVPIPVKYLLVLITAFPTILILYEYVIRRNNALRLLFGMKPQYKPALSNVPTAEAA